MQVNWLMQCLLATTFVSKFKSWLEKLKKEALLTYFVDRVQLT